MRHTGRGKVQSQGLAEKRALTCGARPVRFWGQGLSDVPGRPPPRMRLHVGIQIPEWGNRGRYRRMISLEIYFIRGSKNASNHFLAPKVGREAEGRAGLILNLRSQEPLRGSKNRFAILCL